MWMDIQDYITDDSRISQGLGTEHHDIMALALVKGPSGYHLTCTQQFEVFEDMFWQVYVWPLWYKESNTISEKRQRESLMGSRLDKSEILPSWCWVYMQTGSSLDKRF